MSSMDVIAFLKRLHGRLRLELQRERCSSLRKVNELDALTGGKYDLVLSDNEHGKNVR